MTGQTTANAPHPPRRCAAPGCARPLAPTQRTYCCPACAREGSRRIITAAIAGGRASKREVRA